MINTTVICTGIPIGFRFPKSLVKPMARLFRGRRTSVAPVWRFSIRVQGKPGQRFRPAQVVFFGENRGEIRARSVGPRGLSSAVATAITLVLARNNGFLVHAAFLIGKRGGAIFVGPSGAGKTTLSRNAKGALVVSDEMCAVRKVRSTWRAFGLPVFNKDLSVCPNIEAPIRQVFLLSQARRNSIARVPEREAIWELATELYTPSPLEQERKNLFGNFLDFVATQRPQRLFFTKDFDPGTLLR